MSIGNAVFWFSLGWDTVTSRLGSYLLYSLYKSKSFKELKEIVALIVIHFVSAALFTIFAEMTKNEYVQTTFGNVLVYFVLNFVFIVSVMILLWKMVMLYWLPA